MQHPTSTTHPEVSTQVLFRGPFCSLLAITMLLLEDSSRITRNLLEQTFARVDEHAADPTKKLLHHDQAFVDFDSVRYHLSTPQHRSHLQLSMEIPCWPELQRYGVDAIMQREYGPWLVATEPQYSVTLALDLTQPLGDRSELIERLALLKRNALAAPFERAFAEHRALEAAPPVEGAPPAETLVVRYRPAESFYILPSADRVTVVFSTTFQEETDAVFGKVFLQEFVDARRRPSCQTAPQVLYSSKDAPLEIRHLVPPPRAGVQVGYVTFVLFPRHMTPQTADRTITHIQQFRNYLHYHIKCSKAYMHSRLRFRVAEFLKVLNRAKPEREGEGEKKTARLQRQESDVDTIATSALGEVSDKRSAMGAGSKENKGGRNFVRT